jgi:hypothetical protein
MCDLTCPMYPLDRECFDSKVFLQFLGQFQSWSLSIDPVDGNVASLSRELFRYDGTETSVMTIRTRQVKGLEEFYVSPRSSGNEDIASFESIRHG